MEEPQAIDFLSTLIPFTVVVFIIAIGVVLLTQQFRKNLLKQQLENEEMKAKYQRDLLQTSMQVQESERKRIAQDLHDELGASLSISRMQLVQLSQLTDLNTDMAKQSITTVTQAIETALTSTRRISHELMPVRLVNLGLAAALEEIGEKAHLAAGLKVNFDISEAIETFDWNLKIGLYRIVSELVNSSLKHAEAQLAHLEIQVSDCTIVCNYNDNGKGFDVGKAQKGVGLRSLEARTAAIGGVLTIESETGKGFRFRLVVEKK